MKELEILRNLKIKHKIVKAKTNRLTMRFDRMQTLIIRIPQKFPLKDLEDFVKKHLDWIINTKQKVKEKSLETTLLGKKLKLEILKSHHQGIYKEDDKLIIYAKDEKEVDTLVKNFKKEQAEIIITELFYQVFKTMESEFKTFPKLSFKFYSTRWGCCRPLKNEVILNYYLINVDIECIKYVIYHELAHFKYQNHQKEFHMYLQRFCPREKEFLKKIKQYQI